MEKLVYFRHILLLEFNRETKAVEAARNICVVYEYNAIGESTAETRQENGFSLRSIVLTLVTLHVQEDFRGMMKIV